MRAHYIMQVVATVALALAASAVSAQDCGLEPTPVLKFSASPSSVEPVQITAGTNTLIPSSISYAVDGTTIDVTIAGILKPGAIPLIPLPCWTVSVGPLAAGTYQVNFIQALPPVEAPTTSVVATASLVVADAGRPVFATVVPQHPVAQGASSVRVRASTPSSPVTFVSPHTVVQNGNVLRMEGCYRTASFSVPGVYIATAGLPPVPAGIYRVDYYRSVCNDEGQPASTPGFVFSFNVEVRGSAADWPPPPEVMPVTEYLHSDFEHFFLTADETEQVALDSHQFSGWTIMDNLAAPPAESGRFGFWRSGAGHVPVCRFFSTSFAPKSSHFYTASSDECEKVKSNPDWLFEGEVGYVLPANQETGCAEAVPLYRLYNNGRGGVPSHRFTTDADIRDAMVQGGWLLEGLLGCVPGLPSLYSP